jgi:DeoR/GlpR family transcriptional regulator of sugar metabolism
MLPNERHQEILELLKQKNTISITDFAAELQVSEITVRRDLELLDNNNQIIRIRGGAKLLDNEKVEKDTNFLNRRFYNQAAIQQQEKKAIGKLAASLVKDDETILIDAGSTTLALAKHLQGKRGVTAIVTTVNIAEELEGREGVTTILSGGIFRSKTTTLVNPIMDRMLMQIHADKVFIGVTAVSLTKGFSGNDFLESEVKRQLLNSGKQIYWLVDSTKINSISTIHISPFIQDHCIITDDGIHPESKAQLEKQCKLLISVKERETAHE